MGLLSRLFGNNDEAQTVEVGDFLEFQDANNPRFGHASDVIGFDEEGNPLVECRACGIQHVTPSQIRKVYKRK